MTSTASLGFIAVATAGAFGVGSADAAPRENVKICSLYGAGFYYIPGTNTCTKIYVGVEGGWGSSHTNFNVNPNFDVNGTGGLWGVNGGVMFGIPGTSFYVGPQVGFLSGGMGGTTADPPASPASDYWANKAFIQFAGFTFGRASSFYDFYSGAFLDAIFHGTIFARPSLDVNLGAAIVKTNVNCSCGASASSTTTGFTGGFGINFPIVNTPISLTGQYQYINVPTNDLYIPGRAPISGNINIFKFGAQWAFGSPPAPTPR
jgi:hypothetical protein